MKRWMLQENSRADETDKEYATVFEITVAHTKTQVANPKKFLTSHRRRHITFHP